MSQSQQVVCPNCNSVNRIPPARAAQKAKCGVCHEPLFAGKPADVDAKAFDRQISRNSVPVVVDVWAPWCGPCRMMAPAFEQAARELEPDVRFLKLNSDAEQDVAGRLGIRGIPTMILFRDGREVARQSGAMTASQISAWLKSKLVVAA